MELIFMALLGAVGIMGIVGSSDSSDEPADEAAVPDQPDAPETPAEPPDPVTEAEAPPPQPPPADVDVTLTENADGSLFIALGEEETGSLAALKFEQTANGEDFDRDFSLGLFVVPEGIEIPVDPTGAALDYTSVEDMITTLGLTEIVSFDLGSLEDNFGEDGEDTRIDPPIITSDDPIDIIRVRYGFGDGGEPFFTSEPDETLSPFEQAGVYFNGAERIIVEGDFAGTQGTDYILAEGPEGTAPVMVQGLGGEDVFVSNIAQSTLEGGADDDRIFAPADENTIRGGEGDDTLAIGPNGTGFGGAGDDDLSSLAGAGLFSFNEIEIDMQGSPEDQGSSLYGGAGNDYFTINAPAATGFGEAGDDRFVLTNGGTGLGGDGDDFFNIGAGTTADGGAGNDLFQMVATIQDGDPTAVVTGGEGVDTYEFSVRNAFSTQSALALRITDFDPATDRLSIEEWSLSELDAMRIQEAPDGSYTDIITDFSNTSDARPNAGTTTAIVRLDGVSGLTLDALVTPRANA